MLYRNKKIGDYHQGKYNGLGGKFKPGESPEECAVREVKEESGLQIRDPKLKGFITFPLFDKIDDWYVFVFLIHHYKGDLINSPEGRLEWIKNSELTRIPLWEGDRIFLPWLDQKRFFSAKFDYKDKKLKNWNVVFY